MVLKIVQAVDVSSWPVIVTGIVAIVATQIWLTKNRYPDVPTLKISKRPGFLGEWDDAQASVTDAMQMCELGWQKYSKHGVNYLLNTPMRKVLVLAPKFFKEFMGAPEEVVHTLAAQNIVMQNTYTLSKSINDDNWHMVMPVRRDLVHNTAPSIPYLLEEGKLSLQDYMNLPDGGSARKNAFDMSFAVVVRTANRVLFGQELARNPKWQEVSIEYSTVLFGGADIIKNYPTFLRRTVLKWQTPLSKVQQDGRDCLVPVIKQRLDQEASMDETEWDRVKPNDMIQWVLDATETRDIEDLYLRLLHMTIASVHTTSFTFMEVLHCMLVRPQYLDELREEIESVLRAEGGWTKQALGNLKKLDSFINEASRLCPLSSLKLARLTLQDWTLGDGTVIPKGVLMFANHLPLSTDDGTYENAKTFDPWRQYRLRQEKGQENKNQFVMATYENLTWGYGRHACPGRFFAANEIKLLLALMLLKYDFKPANPSLTLEDITKGRWYNFSRLPLNTVEIDFRDKTAQMPADVRGWCTQE